MVKVTVGTNMDRQTVIVDASTTLREVLEDAGVEYARGGLHLDGVSLIPGDIDKSFEQFGITDKCYLLQVTKTDNA